MKFKDIKYQSIDLAKLKSEVANCIEAFTSAAEINKQNKVMERFNKLQSETYNSLIIMRIRYNQNTRDQYYKQQKEINNSLWPEIDLLFSNFKKVLLESPFLVELKKTWGTELFRRAQTELRINDPKILGLKKQENKLKTAFSQIMSEEKILFDGKELPKSGILRYFISEDREMRKRAQEARAVSLKGNDEKINSIYHDLVQVRTKKAAELGYNNFVQLGYVQQNRHDYNPEDVSTFRENIVTHVVPLLSELYERQRTIIGVEKLHYYDIHLLFKTGNPKTKGNVSFVMEKLGKMFNEMSPETKKAYNLMRDGGFFDLHSRVNKYQGGFNASLPENRLGFILMNMNNTAKDVHVFVHESGHAFQTFMSSEVSIKWMEFYWPTFDIAEIHSLTMQFFSLPWMESIFGADKDKFTYQVLIDSLRELIRSAILDEFQHIVYENPTLRPKDRDFLYKDLMQKYTPYINYETNKYYASGALWKEFRLPFDNPFYMIDYALAQICAIQFWRRSQEDFDRAWNDYLNLCKAGGSKPYLESLQLANLKSPFDESVIKENVNFIKQQIYSLNESIF